MLGVLIRRLAVTSYLMCYHDGASGLKLFVKLVDALYGVAAVTCTHFNFRRGA